jgi:hypothetical protein
LQSYIADFWSAFLVSFLAYFGRSFLYILHEAPEESRG